MAKVIEAFDSRETRGSPPREIIFRFTVLGCFDELEAEGWVQQKLATIATADFRGLVIDSESVTLQKSGYDSFTWEGTWILPAVPEFPGGTTGGGGAEEFGITEFDTTGGTQHITQAISQVPYPTDDGDPGDAAELGIHRVIGWNRDGVDGVDVLLPKLEMSVVFYYDLGQLTTTKIKDFSRMTGRTNIAPYVIGGVVAEAGEALLLGVSGKIVERENKRQWEVVFRFSLSENRQNIVITPTLTVHSKKGHEYLWVLYKKDEIANRFVEIPDAAFVAKVYEDGDFQSVLGAL